MDTIGPNRGHALIVSTTHSKQKYALIRTAWVNQETIFSSQPALSSRIAESSLSEWRRDPKIQSRICKAAWPMAAGTVDMKSGAGVFAKGRVRLPLPWMTHENGIIGHVQIASLCKRPKLICLTPCIVESAV
tara:strand:- start:305 stop:700 length:396 start_codon:yes stop_codon:yes gene_type:complete